METRVNAAGWSALTAAGLLLLSGLFLSGDLLVQHVRLRSAIRACTSEMIPSTDPRIAPIFPEERLLVIRAAGCRAIPLLLDEVEAAGNREFDRGSSALLRSFVRKADRDHIADGTRICWPVYAIGTPDRRQEGLAKTRAWWTAHVELCHPWWKPWARTCMAD